MSRATGELDRMRAEGLVPDRRWASYGDVVNGGLAVLDLVPYAS
jgi:hypothetical protein